MNKAAASLHIFNSLSGKKELFVPLEDKHVGMYVCGPTVYSNVHLGNCRTFISFDLVYRYLKHLGYTVRYVRNITDVDDKINARAAERGISIRALTDKTTAQFHTDCAALGALPPDHEPRATDHIDGMIAIIETLITRGHAYEAEAHVLFDVSSFPDYGKLSGRSTDELRAGARVEVAPYKKSAMDFVLWKPSDANTPGWDSPWGRGRPGWHIECSAMSRAYLGDVFDIHGGGLDLIFPHHENEICQSCAAHDQSHMAHYWMHNGYVTVSGEKMSKSLGNVRTVRDLLGLYPGEVLRFALLSTHYRSPLNFSGEVLDNAKLTLNSFYQALRNTSDICPEDVRPEDTPAFTALLDDLNTPKAIAALHASCKALNKADAKTAATCKGELLAMGRLMGLLGSDPEQWFTESSSSAALTPEDIEQRLAARLEARARKDFAAADAVRDELQAAGIELEDGPKGTTWRRS